MHGSLATSSLIHRTTENKSADEVYKFSVCDALHCIVWCLCVCVCVPRAACSAMAALTRRSLGMRYCFNFCSPLLNEEPRTYSRTLAGLSCRHSTLDCTHAFSVRNMLMGCANDQHRVTGMGLHCLLACRCAVHKHFISLFIHMTPQSCQSNSAEVRSGKTAPYLQWPCKAPMLIGA